MRYSIPCGKETVFFDLPGERVLFTGEPENLPEVDDLEAAIRHALENPLGTPPLRELARGKKNVVLLVEDATRSTPLAEIVPVIVACLGEAGVKDESISFLTAPGTHRVMTEKEIEEKLGPSIVERFLIRQHDAAKPGDMVDLGSVAAGGYVIPVHVNRNALEADLLIGLGSIVPHSDAGFSGGAKILQPGVCDFATTSATHAAAGFCPDIPLGVIEGNPCRAGMEEVARMANLEFILNVVQNCSGKVAGVFAGDCVEAHRAGAVMSRRSFSVPIREQADIVVVSSSPADLDFWQAEKGVTSAYFAVKKGGIIIFAAPCYEGLAHNHPRFREWLALSLEETLARLRKCVPEDRDADVISGVLAVCNCRVRDRARIFSVSPGLSEEDLKALHYIPFPTVQEALDQAFRQIPGASAGILPKGGISLPVLMKSRG